MIHTHLPLKPLLRPWNSLLTPTISQWNLQSHHFNNFSLTFFLHFNFQPILIHYIKPFFNFISSHHIPSSSMFNTKCYAVHRAGKILRQWKFHTLRCTFPVGFRPLRRFIKRLVHPISTPTPTPLPPHYAERQFSFNDTPIFHLKFHSRPRFSCINPKVEIDSEFESRVVDDDGGEWERRRLGACDYEKEEEEEGIDLKAEKFIKMFYEEMKMQSQVSYLRLDEQWNHGICFRT